MNLLFNCIESCFDDIKLCKKAIENNSKPIVRMTMKDCIKNNKKSIIFYQGLLDVYTTDDKQAV